MNENELLKEGQDLRDWENVDCDDSAFDLDALESQLQGELDEQLADLSVLEEDRKKIGNPDSLGNTIKDVVWEQFCNQIGVSAGEDFIKENRGLKFDPRDKAHIQTAENFKSAVELDKKIDAQNKLLKEKRSNKTIDKERIIGEIKLKKLQYERSGLVANHNYISREQLEHNYDRYKNKSHKKYRNEYVKPGMDATLPRAGKLKEQGIDTVTDIYTGRQITTQTKLEDGSTNPLGAEREHVKASSELYKDPSLQMANSDEELARIINDPNNLQGYTTRERNNRKSDKSAEDMDDYDKNKHWEKANKRAEDFIEEKRKEGEDRLEAEGRITQKEEVVRMGGKALRSVVMGLLAELVKDIIGKLVVWLRSANKKFSTFIDSVKEGIKKFFSNLKQHLKTAGDTLLTTIATAVIGPIIGMIKKAWILIKKGVSSVIDAIKYLKNPENKNLPFSLKMMNVGKILIAGLTAGGAIVLGEVIEKGLLAIPAFAIQIPLLGSLANIIGIFLGAIVSGIIGALALRLIDKLIAKRMERLNTSQQIDKRNEILSTQEKLVVVNEAKMYKAIDDTMSNVSDRHKQAGDMIRSAYDNIIANSDAIKNGDSPTADEQSENKNDLDDLFDKLAEI